ncbi:MAG: shikimate dehydrogenase [Candidatus Firestonebacteria bacterium]
MAVEINGLTKLTGVFGYPISHSLSPQMHNAAFEYKRLNYVYVPFEVHPKNLKNVLKNLSSSGIVGINLTIPHKEIAYSCVDVLSKEAKLTKAVNTISVRRNKLYGFNTDVEGFLKSLKLDGHINPKGKNVLILGAGGAAKGVAFSLLSAGIRSLIIANRTYKRAENLVKEINNLSRIDSLAIPLKEDYIKEIIGDIDILINTTSVGLYKNDKSLPTHHQRVRGLLSHKSLHSKLLVYDLIYNPVETPLMKEAKIVGAKTLNGLGMLLYQGALSWEIWTGKSAPVEIMKDALLKAIKNVK